MTDAEFRRALLLERYGPLAVERTNPIPKRIPREPKTGDAK